MQNSALTPVQVLGFIEAALESIGISCFAFNCRCSLWYRVSNRHLTLGFFGEVWDVVAGEWEQPLLWFYIAKCCKRNCFWLSQAE